MPAGCPHRVENLTDTLALSCNYVDATNIDMSLAALQDQARTSRALAENEVHQRKDCSFSLVACPYLNAPLSDDCSPPKCQLVKRELLFRLSPRTVDDVHQKHACSSHGCLRCGSDDVSSGLSVPQSAHFLRTRQPRQVGILTCFRTTWTLARPHQARPLDTRHYLTHGNVNPSCRRRLRPLRTLKLPRWHLLWAIATESWPVDRRKCRGRCSRNGHEKARLLNGCRTPGSSKMGIWCSCAVGVPGDAKEDGFQNTPSSRLGAF